MTEPLSMGDLRAIVSTPTDTRPADIVSLKRKIAELEAAEAAALVGGRLDTEKAENVTTLRAGEIGFKNFRDDWDVIRPDGQVGSHIGDYERFGKAYWLEHAKNILNLKNSDIYRFLIQLASYTSKTPEEFTQSLLYNDFLNDVSVLAALATNSPEALGNKLDDEDTSHRAGTSDPVRLMGGLASSSSSASDDKPFTRIAGDIVRDAGEAILRADEEAIDPDNNLAFMGGAAGAGVARAINDADKRATAEREAKEKRASQLLLELVRNENKPERHFNRLDKATKRDLLYSLLANGKHTKGDLEIVERLFPKKVRPELNWILHPQIGGMVFVTDEIVGRVRDCINTLDLECRSAFPRLTEQDITTGNYMEQTARWVAASRNLVNRNRFTMSQAATNRLERDRDLAMAALVDIHHRSNGQPRAILTQTERLAEYYGISKFLRTS